MVTCLIVRCTFIDVCNNTGGNYVYQYEQIYINFYSNMISSKCLFKCEVLKTYFILNNSDIPM